MSKFLVRSYSILHEEYKAKYWHYNFKSLIMLLVHGGMKNDQYTIKAFYTRIEYFAIKGPYS